MHNVSVSSGAVPEVSIKSLKEGQIVRTRNGRHGIVIKTYDCDGDPETRVVLFDSGAKAGYPLEPVTVVPKGTTITIEVDCL